MRRRDFLSGLAAAIPAAAVLFRGTPAKATPKLVAPRIKSFDEVIGVRMPDHPLQVTPDKSHGLRHAWFSMKMALGRAGGFNVYENWLGQWVPVSGIAESYDEGVKDYGWDDMVYLGLVKLDKHLPPLIGGWGHPFSRQPDEIIIFEHRAVSPIRSLRGVHMEHIPNEWREWIGAASPQNPQSLSRFPTTLLHRRNRC